MSQQSGLVTVVKTESSTTACVTSNSVLYTKHS